MGEVVDFVQEDQAVAVVDRVVVVEDSRGCRRGVVQAEDLSIPR